MTKHIFITGGVVSSLGKGTDQRFGWHVAREEARADGPDAEARSVYQCRPRDDEPLSAWRRFTFSTTAARLTSI